MLGMGVTYNVPQSPYNIYVENKLKFIPTGGLGGTNQGVIQIYGAENISITRLYLTIKLHKVFNKIKSHGVTRPKFWKMSFQGVKSKKSDFSKQKKKVSKKFKNCSGHPIKDNNLHFLGKFHDFWGYRSWDIFCPVQITPWKITKSLHITIWLIQPYVLAISAILAYLTPILREKLVWNDILCLI